MSVSLEDQLKRRPVSRARVNELRAEILARAKRFSDAEVAAEYWRARTGTRLRVYQRDEDGNILDVYGPGWEYEYDVLARFATLPHYDEDDDGL